MYLLELSKKGNIIEEDDGSFDIWDFIQQFFPGTAGGGLPAILKGLRGNR